jgi:hypothetical protein
VVQHLLQFLRNVLVVEVEEVMREEPLTMLQVVQLIIWVVLIHLLQLQHLLPFLVFLLDLVAVDRLEVLVMPILLVELDPEVAAAAAAEQGKGRDQDHLLQVVLVVLDIFELLGNRGNIK